MAAVFICRHISFIADADKAFAKVAKYCISKSEGGLFMSIFFSSLAHNLSALRLNLRAYKSNTPGYIEFLF